VLIEPSGLTVMIKLQSDASPNAGQVAAPAGDAKASADAAAAKADNANALFIRALLA
jgi:hypothetical protein